MAEAPPLKGITEGNPAPFKRKLHGHPGNPANSLIRQERPENRNAGVSRRRECLKPPTGITEGNPEHSFNRAINPAKRDRNLPLTAIKIT